MKKYIYQNDPKLNEEIQEFGCYFRSCLWIAEQRTGQVFDHQAINTLYKTAKEQGYINSKFEVDKPHKIIEEAFIALNDGRKVYQNGIFEKGVLTFWNWAKEERYYQRIDALIQKVITVHGNTHFRVVDKYGQILFDPYYPSPAVKSIEYSTLYFIGEVA